MMAFAMGIWLSSPRPRVRVTAGSLFAIGAIGLTGPTLFEMEVRGSPPSTADVLHIAVTAALVLCILAAVTVGAKLRGPWFRRYSFATLLVMVVFGSWPRSPAVASPPASRRPGSACSSASTSALFLLWMAVLSVALHGVETHDGLVPNDLGVVNRPTRHGHGVARAEDELVPAQVDAKSP
jgi:hypothetical protein